MSVRTRWKNYKLKALRRKLDKEGARLYERSNKEKDESIIDDWLDHHQEEFDYIDAQIKQNDSRAILDYAEKLYIPTPSFNDKDKWVSAEDLRVSPIEYWRVLTPEAMTEVRSAIRREKRERLEVVETRLKIFGAFVTPLIGLVGAVIGLIAILKK
jgi:hypothetical protein